MHKDAPKLLDTLWQLQKDPDFAAGDILLTTELSADEGQALQLQLLERWLNEGETLGGWKIGMTSGESRDALGAGIRPFGFVLASRMLGTGADIPRAHLYRGGVENELCFIMNSPLGEHATAESARAAVRHAAPGFEINQKGFQMLTVKKIQLSRPKDRAYKPFDLQELNSIFIVSHVVTFV